jgi:hypothetical protein
LDKFKDNIDKQIESNQGKNLFFDAPDQTLRFLQETIDAIGRIGDIDKDYENILIDYATDKTLQEFCRINQYYSFNKAAINDLRKIYIALFSSIRDKYSSIETISEDHYQNLKLWLKKTNPSAEKTYLQQDLIIDPVACSEYSADLQIHILQIDISRLVEPVLDIGCGKKEHLVNYLRKAGFEAFGLDRFSKHSKYFIKADWLDFEYGMGKWGTITSNLGFSNHFNHQHYKEDGNFISYAKKYMDILNALKIGGCFYYAPDLPFIEEYLDRSKFQVIKKNIENYNFKTTIVKRLK